MNQDKYVFSQLSTFLNRTQFNNYVRKYDGNRYVKHFTCWNQLLAMIFGQLSNRESLRDFRAYDSFKELYRIHLTGSFFVVRAKSNLKCKFCKWKRRMPKNILSDAEVKLIGYTSEKKYPESFRVICFYDKENDREFTFMTNAKHISALDIANLYKKRWLVELFFKWLKQHLKIKRFWGTTENAVRIQISIAIITYCLVAIVQHDMQLNRSTYEVLQILSISLTDKTPLQYLFNKTNFNEVKEQLNPFFPGWFD